MSELIATSAGGRWQHRLENVPPWAWLAVQAGALWTHWRWAAARVVDGSDDPLGVVALALLLWFVVRLAPELRGQPRPGWLGAALALSVAVGVLAWWLWTPSRAVGRSVVVRLHF